MPVESNLIIKTSVPKPSSLLGFSTIKKNLDDIDTKLTEITSKAWTIKLGVDLSGIPELDRLLAAARSAGAAAAGGGSGNRGGGTGGGGNNGAGPSGSPRIPDSVPLSNQRTSLNENEDPTSRTDTRELKNRRRRLKQDTHFTQEVDENGTPTGRLELAGYTVSEQFNRTGRGLRRARSQFIDEQLDQRRNVEADVVDTGISKGVRFHVEKLEAVTNTARAANGDLLILDKRILEINTKTQQAVEYNVRNEKSYTRLRKEKEQEVATQKKFEEHDLRTNVYLKQRQELIAKGLTLLSEEENRVTRITKAVLAGRDAEGRPFKTTITNAPDREFSTKTTYASPENNKAQEADAILARNRAKFQQQSADAIAQGFVASQPKTKTSFDSMGRSISTVTQEFSKATQVGLGKYNVALRILTESTGKMEEKTLVGGGAIRYMGDSFLTAIGKVKLWTAATSAVFLAIQAMKEAARASQELENNTIFLARVGGGLSDTERKIAKGTIESTKAVRDNVSGFNYRRDAARGLTQELLDLATATGADAIASQRAAAIFSRAGQDRAETILSVKASLLAAKIAELEVVDAANLLSAAMLQFNLKARDLLPTLDTLNELSNHYRVTTNDLLQSISRTGSVIEAQGGRLSELAAVTAIVSQRTSRSGAEIGNAIKTISSRLVSPEVAKSIEQVGISLRNQDGTAKSLSEVMLELKNTFASLTLAERDQLTVGIAGVRQRNILISAIEGSVDSIIAEIDVLRKAGSAEDEFRESSTTLSSAVQRLTNTLIKFVSVTGGPITDAIKSVINILQGFIAILNSGVGQAALKVLLFATAFYAVDKAATKLRPGIQGLTTDMKALAAAAVGTTNKVESVPSRAKELLRYSAFRDVLPARLATTETTLGPLDPTRRNFRGGYLDSHSPRSNNLIRNTVVNSFMAGGDGDLVKSYAAREKAINGLEKSQTLLGRAMMRTSSIANGAGTAFKNMATGIYAAGKAVITTIGSFLKANALVLVITVGIGYLIKKLGEYAERQAVNNAAIETGIQLAEKQVVAEEKKATATKVAANAILQQIDAVGKLNKKGSTGAEDKIKDIERDIRRLASAASITIPINFDFKSANAAEEFRKLANEKAQSDARNQAAALDVLVGNKTKDVKNKNERLGQIDYELGVRNEFKKNGGFGSSQSAVDPTGSVLGFLETNYSNDTEITKLQTEEAKLRGEVADTNAELAETYQKIRGLRDGADFIKANTDELARLETNMKAAGDAAKKLREDSKFTLEVGKALDPDGMSAVTQNLFDQQAALEKLDSEIAEYQKLMNGKEYRLDDELKNWEEQKQAVTELTREIAVMHAERDRKDFADNKVAIDSLITNRNVLADRAARSPDVAGVAGLLDLKAERNSILSQVQARANGADQQGGDKSLADKYAIQQGLISLKEKELALAKELQNSEAKIAEERKKSTAELQKSLGAMGAEDKIRFETALNYFEQNPNAKITTSQLFAGDAASNNVIQNYFADHVVQDPNDPLAKRLAATVRTPDQVRLDKEQAAIDKIKDGRTTDEFVNDQVRAAQDSVNRIRELQGQSALLFDEELSNSIANTPINVDLSQTADALTGVIDRLAKGFDDAMAKQVNSLKAYVDSKTANLRTDPTIRNPGGHATE